MSRRERGYQEYEQIRIRGALFEITPGSAAPKEMGGHYWNLKRVEEPTITVQRAVRERSRAVRQAVSVWLAFFILGQVITTVVGRAWGWW